MPTQIASSILIGFALILGSSANRSPAADEKQDQAAAEIEKLVGTWKLIGGIQNGDPLTKEQLQGKSLTFTAEKFPGKFVSLVPFLPAGTMNATAVSWSVHPDTAPREITFSRFYGLRISNYPGIYKLNDDTLTLCVDFTASPDGPPNRQRPTKFEALKDSPYTLLTFKRAK